jgi:hypothetical protein
MTKLALLAICSAMALAACAKTDSEDLLTHGMSAELEARATGDGTTLVSATLFVGDPSDLNFVELQGDDDLIAENSGQQMEMGESSLGNIVSYSAVFTTDEEGDEFVVDFERSLDAGAPDSSVTLPAKYTVDAVDTAQSRAADLVLSWDEPSDDDMAWRADGSCIELAGAPIDANATDLTISASTLVAVAGADPSCQVTITLTRQREGDLDPGYGHGGSILGTQIRTVVFTSNP